MSDTPTSGKWKPKLLSSSLPLEYEVAKALVSVDFSVHSDFSYHRAQQGHDIEWSVDIRAIRQTLVVPGAKRGCSFDLLVECKHRTRQSAWFFVPEPNGRMAPQQYDVVRGVEEFTPWFLTDPAWYTSNFDLPVCYKGAEIDLSSGNVQDTELRHGLSQLQFAIPPLLARRIATPGTSFGVVDNTPFFFSALLVTNAPLIVAGADLDTNRVERAEHLSDLERRG